MIHSGTTPGMVPLWFPGVPTEDNGTPSGDNLIPNYPNRVIIPGNQLHRIGVLRGTIVIFRLKDSITSHEYQKSVGLKKYTYSFNALKISL